MYTRADFAAAHVFYRNATGRAKAAAERQTPVPGTKAARMLRLGNRSARLSKADFGKSRPALLKKESFRLPQKLNRGLYPKPGEKKKMKIDYASEHKTASRKHASERLKDSFEKESFTVYQKSPDRTFARFNCQAFGSMQNAASRKILHLPFFRKAACDRRAGKPPAALPPGSKSRVFR